MIFVTQWRLLLLFPVVWPIDRQTCNMVQIPGLNFWNIALYNIELVGNKACVQFHLLVHYDIDFDILALTQWRLLLLFPVKRPIDRQTCENKSDPLLLDKLFFKIHLHWVHRTICICHKQKKISQVFPAGFEPTMVPTASILCPTPLTTAPQWLQCTVYLVSKY